MIRAGTLFLDVCSAVSNVASTVGAVLLVGEAFRWWDLL